MSDGALTVPVACNPQALLAQDWAEHRATSLRLFGELREAMEELEDGYAFRFPAAALPLAAAFVHGWFLAQGVTRRSGVRGPPWAPPIAAVRCGWPRRSW